MEIIYYHAQDNIKVANNKNIPTVLECFIHFIKHIFIFKLYIDGNYVRKSRDEMFKLQLLLHPEYACCKE